MGGFNFNRRQCIRALKKSGFYIGNKRRGIHDKFYPPEAIAEHLTGAQPRFIMVPRGSELHCQPEIISELRKMGGEDLVKRFRDCL